MFASAPPSSHVVVVLEENHDYSSVVGSSSMPYLNSLASQYGLATQYYANTHPSIGNYFMLTTGAIITNDDGWSGKITDDNIVRHMIQSGKTWKSYAESLPSVGYTGGDQGSYMQHHNPFTYFSDVVDSSAEKQNLVPFTQFAKDLASGQLPNFSFLVPNTQNDAHDGTLQQADTWLKTNIAPLLADPSFKQDGLLVIVFDEAGADATNGGGKVAGVVVGPKVKTQYKSTTKYAHESTLRMVMESMGMTIFPGAAVSAPSMDEFFTTSTPTPTPVADFQISSSPSTQTMPRGSSTTYTLTVTPVNGFKSAVALSCPTLPAGITCSFDQNSVTPTSGPVTAKLTVAASTSAKLQRHSSVWSALALWLPGVSLGMVVVPAISRKKRWLLLLGVLALITLMFVACGGANTATNPNGGGTAPTPTPSPTPTPTSPAPAPSTMSIQVTATSGSIQHSANVSLTLQ